MAGTELPCDAVLSWFHFLPPSLPHNVQLILPSNNCPSLTNTIGQDVNYKSELNNVISSDLDNEGWQPPLLITTIRI